MGSSEVLHAFSLFHTAHPAPFFLTHAAMAATHRTLHTLEGQKTQSDRLENAHSVQRKTHFSSVHVSPAEAPTTALWFHD